MIRRLWNRLLDRVCGPVENHAYSETIQVGPLAPNPVIDACVEATRERLYGPRGPLDGDLQTAVATMRRGMQHVRRP